MKIPGPHLTRPTTFAHVEWLFFDMGSTLVDDCAAYRQWFANAAALTGGALSALDIEREYCAGMARYQPTIAGQLRPYGFTGASAENLYPAELDQAYPEAQSLLERLAGSYKLGVIANQSPGSQARLQRYGLLSYFLVVVASAEAGVAKPDPRIFELALAEAGCTPTTALMIGDRPDNDIYPAKRLGLKTVRIRQGYAASQEPRSPDYEADVTVDHLTDLLPLFLAATNQ